MVDGVRIITDPTAPRGERWITLTETAWNRMQEAVRTRANGKCERCLSAASQGDTHHTRGRGAGKRDDHPDALVNLCRRCHHHTHNPAAVAAKK